MSDLSEDFKSAREFVEKYFKVIEISFKHPYMNQGNVLFYSDKIFFRFNVPYNQSTPISTIDSYDRRVKNYLESVGGGFTVGDLEYISNIVKTICETENEDG